MRRAAIVIPLLAVMLSTEFILLDEPTDPQECVEVTVIGFQHAYRYQQFTVTTRGVSDGASTGGNARGNAGAPQIWQPGRFASEFDTLFRGPAILVIRHGRWIGDDHLRLAMRCPPGKGAASVVMHRDPHRFSGNMDNDSTVLLRIFAVVAAVYGSLFLIGRWLWKRWDARLAKRSDHRTT